jgi:hypothetical protein
MKELIQVGRIAAVNLPMKAERIGLSLLCHNLIYQMNHYDPYWKFNYAERREVKLPESNWTILGRALELTEEQKVLTIIHSSISDKTIVITGRLDVFYDAFLEAHQIDNNYIIILNTTNTKE